MQLKTLQIVWHGKEPVLSVDFQPNSHTLVSGGQDGEVKHWEVVSEEDGSPGVRFINSYPVNSKSVNCVRFSPTGDMMASAGDKGEVLLWRFAPFVPGSSGAAPVAFGSGFGPSGAGGEGGGPPSPSSGTSAGGLWRQVGMLRGHCDDVLDLAWAPDGSALLSGGIENNCILWDVEGRKQLKWLQDHGHYVQGVAWDPMGRFIASQSADRTARIYALKPPGEAVVGKRSGTASSSGPITSASLAREGFYPAATLSKGPLPQAPQPQGPTPGRQQQPQQQPPPQGAAGDATPTVPLHAGAGAGGAGGGATKQPLFCDDSLPTFFRRLAWSPDGSVLAAPAGIFKSAASAPLTSTTHVFCRGEWSGPALSLPCLSKGALGVRFCPRLFRAPTPQPPPAPAPTAAGGAATTPQYQQHQQKHAAAAAAAGAGVMRLPYRVVLAVASLDSVLLYDLQALEPLAVLGGVHFAAVTDMAWSDDGRFLVVASRDGYCTICSFEEGELGVPLTPEELPPGVAAAVSRAAARRYRERSAAATAAAAAGKAAAVAAGTANGNAAATTAAAGGMGTTSEDPTAPLNQIQMQTGSVPVAIAGDAVGNAPLQASGGTTATKCGEVPAVGGGPGSKTTATKRLADSPPGGTAAAPKPKRIQPIPLSATVLAAAPPAGPAAGPTGVVPVAATAAALPSSAARTGAAVPGGSPPRRRIAPVRIDGPAATSTGAAAAASAHAGAAAQQPQALQQQLPGAGGATSHTPQGAAAAGGLEAPDSSMTMPTPQVLVFGTPPPATGPPDARPAAPTHPTPPHAPSAAPPHHQPPAQQPQERAVQAAPPPAPTRVKRLTPIPVSRGQGPTPAVAGTEASGSGATPPPAAGAQPPTLPPPQQLQRSEVAGAAGAPVAADEGNENVAAQASEGQGAAAPTAAAASRGGGATGVSGVPTANGAGGGGGARGGVSRIPRLSVAQLAVMRGAAAAKQAGGGC